MEQVKGRSSIGNVKTMKIEDKDIEILKNYREVGVSPCSKCSKTSICNGDCDKVREY